MRRCTTSSSGGAPTPARALERIRRAGRTTRFAGTANAHLWLVEPPSRWSRLLGSERLLERRIRAVTALAAGRVR